MSLSPKKKKVPRKSKKKLIRQSSRNLTEYLEHKFKEIGFKIENSWIYEDSWNDDSPRRVYNNMRIIDETKMVETPFSKVNPMATIQFREYPDYIEFYSIDVKPHGTGMGTKILEVFREYADSKHKGILATKVQNPRWARKTKMKKRRVIVDDKPLEYFGFGEYAYGVVPKGVIDYSWLER